MPQANRLLVSLVLVFATSWLCLASGDDPVPKPKNPPKAEDSLAVARERQAARAQYELARAKAQVEEMRARLELAREQAEVSRSRFKAGQDTQVAVRQAETEVIAAQAAVEAATAQLALQNKEIELLQKELSVARDDQAKRQAEIAAMESDLAVTLARLSQIEAEKAGKEEAWKTLLSRSKSKETMQKVEAERGKYEAWLQEAQAQTILRKAQLQARKDGTGKRVTIEAPRLTDGSEVIHMLFSAAGASYVVDHNVRAPAVSLSLNDVPFEKALNIVMEALGLRYEVKDGIYYIKPATQSSARIIGYLGDPGAVSVPMATYGGSSRGGYLSRSSLSVPRIGVGLSLSPNRAAPSGRASANLPVPPTPRLPGIPAPASAPVLAPPNVQYSPPVVARPADPMISSPLAPGPYVGATPAETRSTFKCPSCKKTETIVHSNATARGRWKYCPYCGKRVK